MFRQAGTSGAPRREPAHRRGIPGLNRSPETIRRPGVDFMTVNSRISIDNRPDVTDAIHTTMTGWDET